MHHEDSGVEKVFQHKVPVTYRVHAIGRYAFKTQFLGHHPAVERKGGAGQGSTTQGKHVHSHETLSETLPIPLQHLIVGEQVMGEEYRLGRL